MSVVLEDMLNLPWERAKGVINRNFTKLQTVFNVQAAANAVTVAQLPLSPSGQGVMRSVTDAVTNTWGAAITQGGGTYHVLAYWNGSSWTVAAK